MAHQYPMCDLRNHGSRHLEFKTRYPAPDRSGLRYYLDVYFFTPSYLQLDDRRYGVDGFLRDFRANTRLSTPAISLSKVVDPDFELSPLTRINAVLDTIGSGEPVDEDRLLYELRTLVNVYRVEVRSTRRLIRDELVESEDPETILEVVSKLIDESDFFLKRVRETGRRFLDPHVSDSLRTAMDWADESISLATEVERFKLHRVLSTRDDLAKARDLLFERLDTERDYRIKRGFSSWVNPDSDRQNEELLYRESTLKKWSQSVMYMSREQSSGTGGVGHILAAIAAAAAMTFAVISTILAQRLFASYSVPWALLIVISYIFKDRIKEILRTILARLLPGFVVDDASRLHDPASGARVGRTRSIVRFCTPEALPGRVVAERNSYPRPFVSILPSENVIHYRRRIKLNGKLLQQSHSRLESVTEVLRLKLETWLEEMDTPENVLSYLGTKKIKTVSAARVYHLNIVVSLTHDDRTELFHYRVVLTRDGISRIEEIRKDPVG